MNKYDDDNGNPIPTQYMRGVDSESGYTVYGPCPDCGKTFHSKAGYFGHREKFRERGLCPHATTAKTGSSDEQIPSHYHEPCAGEKTGITHYGPCPNCGGYLTSESAYFYHRETLRHTGQCPKPPKDRSGACPYFVLPGRPIPELRRCTQCGAEHASKTDLCGMCMFGPLAMANRVLGIEG
jgi:hypothetical protein